MSIIRSVLFNVYFLVLTLLMGVGAIPVRLLSRRSTALRYAKLWSRLVLAGLKTLCGIRIDIQGLENLPDGPCLIASRHQSYFDGFIWMLLGRKPAYVIKKELTRIPLVGPMLVLTGMIPVERTAGAKALRSLMTATQAAFEDDRQVILFPEGTRSLPGENTPLQPGIVALARQSPVPIIPVATDSGLCWPRAGLLKKAGTIRIVIGAPLSATRDRGALVSAITDSWATLLPSEPL